jgi:hypothetical protein
MTRPTRWNLKAPSADETARHKAILDMLMFALPRGFAWHCPNGVHLRGTDAERAIEWNRMLALGAMPGFPDIAIAQDGRLFGLEVKTPDGVQSDDQLQVQGRFGLAGIPYAIVCDAEEAYRTLDAWGLALRRLDWIIQPRPPRLHSLARPLQAEWQEAAGEAVTAWRRWLEALPPRRDIWQELAGTENRLRQLAMGYAR